MKINHLLEMRGCHELVYLKDRADTVVELPTLWSIESKRKPDGISEQSCERRRCSVNTFLKEVVIMSLQAR